MINYLRIAVVAAVFAAGWFSNEWRLSGQIRKAEADRIELTLQIERANAQLNQVIAAKAAAEQEALDNARNTVREQVRNYEDNADSYCELSADWVRIHDGATARMPENTNTPGGVDAGTGRAATDFTALEVVTENYADCHETASRLIVLQEWVNRTLNEANR